MTPMFANQSSHSGSYLDGLFLRLKNGKYVSDLSHGNLLRHPYMIHSDDPIIGPS